MFRLVRRFLKLGVIRDYSGFLGQPIKQYKFVHISRLLQATEQPTGGQYQFLGPVPQDRLTIKFARSSGPGGQNVNKVNTKVEIRFHVESADWIPEEVREKLLKRERNRVNKNGELVLTSTQFRSQLKNVKDAISRLQTIIKDASFVPAGPSQQQQDHIKILARNFNERRLATKKFASQKKRGRKSDH